MFVKPAPDRSVRWPGTLRLLDAAGANVPDTAFWLRAVSRGDVLVVSPSTSTAQAQPQASVSEKLPEPEGKSA